MTRFALKGILGRKLRTVLTALAIVLGVAMVSGTFVLTDSIDDAFNPIFTDVYRGTDATITGKTAFDLGDNGSVAPPFDESLLAKVKALPDTGAAVGGVGGDAQLIGTDGKAIIFGGAPNLGFSIDPKQPSLNSLSLVSGSWPNDGEVVIDRSTAGKKDLKIGQEIGVQAEGPTEKLRISGFVKFGSVSSIGGATLAGFTLPTAQKLFAKPGKLDQIRVAAKQGVSPEALVAEIQKILPEGTQVRTGEAQAQEDASDTNAFISFLRTFLLVFGGIALFVGAFVIANSLSITIAQRTREFATLRTLGASRQQIMISVTIEAFVVGLVASIVGLLLGLGLAKGLFALFDAVGFTLPNSGLLFQGHTILYSLLVGVGVTVLAGMYPALLATGVPPIAAVREGAVLPADPFDPIRGTPQAVAVTAAGIVIAAIGIVGRPWTTFFAIALAVIGLVLVLFGNSLFRSRVVGAVVTIGLGALALLYGLFVHGLGTSQVLLWLGVGVLLLFAGVARITTRLVPPLSKVLSPVARWAILALMIVTLPIWFPIWGLYWLYRYAAFTPGWGIWRILALVAFVATIVNPIALIVAIMWIRKAAFGWQPEWPVQFPRFLPERESTQLGGENSRRNPQRTASTAAALMIGLALVTLVATLAAGIVQSFTGAVNDIFTGDYSITAQNNFDPIPISAAEAAAKAPGVTAVGSVRTGDALVFDKTIFATAVDPGASQVIALDWVRRLAGDVLEPGPGRCLRRQGLRKAPRPRDGLADRRHLHQRRHQAVHDRGHLRPAAGWHAVRPRDDLRRCLGCEQLRPAEPLLVREDGGWRDRREPRGARQGTRAVPERQGAVAAGLHRQPDLRSQLDPEHPLCPARAVGPDQPLRDREHAGADRVRAHARDRDAARDRHDATPGAAHDPARKRDHGADRGGVRHRARARARCAPDRPDRLPRVRVPDDAGDRVRGRGDPRRDRRGDLPRASRRQARPARSAAL